MVVLGVRVLGPRLKASGLIVQFSKECRQAYRMDAAACGCAAADLS